MHDGQIARNALRPQRLRSAGAAADGVTGRARGGVGVQDSSGELLKEIRLRGVDAEVPQLHLRLRPGQRRGAHVRIRVAMLVREFEHLRFGPSATQVQNAMRAVPPAGTRRR